MKGPMWFLAPDPMNNLTAFGHEYALIVGSHFTMATNVRLSIQLAFPNK